jgi:transposase-like protein
METIGKIRRRRLVQGDSISAIARDLGLARNTVKRALRFEGEGYEYRRERQPQPKLGPFIALLESWLTAEEQLPAREQRTAQRLYEALRVEGYTLRLRARSTLFCLMAGCWISLCGKSRRVAMLGENSWSASLWLFFGEMRSLMARASRTFLKPSR